MVSSFLSFLDHTQRRTTVGRTPLYEWSPRLRDLYLTTHNTHNIQISMPPAGFGPKISAGERPQTYVLRWVHTCNVNAYRNTVSWQCGRDLWPRNASKLVYVITLRACLVHCRYLAVASKGWYGYGLSRFGRATWHVTTVRSSPLLFIPDVSVLKNGANL
jgi:hypothetical protein